jgi:hypothetical protein
MGIDHRRVNLFMSQKFLNRSDVMTCFEEMGRLLYLPIRNFFIPLNGIEKLGE